MKLKQPVKRLISSIYYSLQKSNLVNSVKKAGFRVLLYHSINKADADDTLGIRITLENFSEQMEFLYRGGYKVCRLKELVESIEKMKAIPKKAIAITFDDGYKDNLENAFPILQRFNFPATIFITPSYIECKKYNAQDYWVKWEYLSWQDIRQLSSLNITIGSHSFSHRRLSNLTLEEMEKEVINSKQRLEERLGTPVKLFSYPHGSVNQKLKDVLRQVGYIGACSSLVGRNDYRTDVFELKRTEISTNDDISEFKKKLNGCYDWITYFKGGRD